jgi:hypothetical protein
LAQVNALQEELEELREMKEDIQRKEKQQAAIIENQVRLPTCHQQQYACMHAPQSSRGYEWSTLQDLPVLLPATYTI